MRPSVPAEDALTVLNNKYIRRNFHYTFLQIGTKLQHLEHIVTVGIQLHMLSFVNKEYGCPIQSLPNTQ